MQRCAQCEAENRDTARFCEQCGKALSRDESKASPLKESKAASLPSMVDDVVETMAREPGVRKGWGFRMGILFLLLLLCAAFWWSWRGGEEANPLVVNNAKGSEQGVQMPARAPSLAEQMGQTSVATSINNPVTSQEQKELVASDAQATASAASKSSKLRNPEEKKPKVARTEKASSNNTVVPAAKTEAPASVHPLSTAQEVARCEKMSVFARQPCLWRACNNKWGKDGCPSYD